MFTVPKKTLEIFSSLLNGVNSPYSSAKSFYLNPTAQNGQFTPWSCCLLSDKFVFMLMVAENSAKKFLPPIGVMVASEKAQQKIEEPVPDGWTLDLCIYEPAEVAPPYVRPRRPHSLAEGAD